MRADRSGGQVTIERLGAWVIKCNPAKTSIAPMLAAGATTPHWCVADNYRTRLMRPGQRALFWVSGRPDRGIWGAGHLDGEVWSDGARLHVPVRIPLLAQPITAAELAAIPGLAGIETLRAPQQSNPSWVSDIELAFIDRLLGSRPA
ncbi:EVE domain-containing protein [Mycolicibacterium bacteremicum]|uniref:EVE domain-containing protein n=1 Tax=Mycolicibacterium bacteremicum TaxID=564198 RepID=UPI0026EC5139|nr:EVE domain-containing protein [Mycolicibacterium bacteremicum]